MNDNEILKKHIGDAELILIGIGEEFFDNCNDFEKIYDDLLFDNRIEGLQMSSLFKEVLLKRWLRENVSENLEKAYSNIAKMCTDKNYYIVSLATDDRIHQFGLEKIVTPCGGRKRFQRKIQNESEILDLEMASKLENEIYEAFQLRDFEKLALFNQTHKNDGLEYNNIFSNEYNEEGYLDDWNNYLKWVQGTVNRKVCVLELGVSFRLPSVIRWPFEKIAFYNNEAIFYRINEHLFQMTAELKDKGISIPENAVTFLGNLFV